MKWHWFWILLICCFQDDCSAEETPTTGTLPDICRSTLSTTTVTTTTVTEVEPDCSTSDTTTTISGTTDAIPEIKLNEVYIDGKGDSSFIEIKRKDSTTVLDLKNYFVAILSTNYDKGFHFQMKAVIPLEGKTMEIGEAIGYIGKIGLHANHIKTFGTVDVMYAPRNNFNSLLKVKNNGYLVIMLLYSNENKWNNEQLNPLSSELYQWILESYTDLIIYRGTKASTKCRTISQIFGQRIPTNLLTTFLEDTSRLEQTSSSNCGVLFQAFQMDQWKLTTPSVGEENICGDGGTINVDRDFARVSGPLNQEDCSDDCNYESNACSIKEDKLDNVLTNSKQTGSGTCSTSSNIAELKSTSAANKRRKQELTDDTSKLDTKWCSASQFKKEWETHIQCKMSNLLPLAGIVKTISQV